MQLEQMKRNGVSYEVGIKDTHSVIYATTSIKQPGHTISDVKIDMSGAFGWKLRDMMDHFSMSNSEREVRLKKYGLSVEDVVKVNYDIYIDVLPLTN